MADVLLTRTEYEALPEDFRTAFEEASKQRLRLSALRGKLNYSKVATAMSALYERILHVIEAQNHEKSTGYIAMMYLTHWGNVRPGTNCERNSVTNTTLTKETLEDPTTWISSMFPEQAATALRLLVHYRSPRFKYTDNFDPPPDNKLVTLGTHLIALREWYRSCGEEKKLIREQDSDGCGNGKLDRTMSELLIMQLCLALGKVYGDEIWPAPPADPDQEVSSSGGERKGEVKSSSSEPPTDDTVDAGGGSSGQQVESAEASDESAPAMLPTRPADRAVVGCKRPRAVGGKGFFTVARKAPMTNEYSREHARQGSLVKTQEVSHCHEYIRKNAPGETENVIAGVEIDDVVFYTDVSKVRRDGAGNVVAREFHEVKAGVSHSHLKEAIGSLAFMSYALKMHPPDVAVELFLDVPASLPDIHCSLMAELGVTVTVWPEMLTFVDV